MGMRSLTGKALGTVLAFTAGTIMLCVSTLVEAQSAKSKASISTRKAAQGALHAGYKSLQGKQNKQAIVDLTRAIKSGKLRSSEMAKALYYRGRAYRNAQRPADAIADLTSALWVKGALSERERKEALALRQKTYQQLGVSGPAIASTTTTTERAPQLAPPTKPQRTASPKIPTRKPTQQARAGQSNWTATTKNSSGTSNPIAQASKGVTSFFSNLFGGNSANSSTTGSANASSPSATSAVQPQSSTWQSQTRTAQTTRTRVPPKQATPTQVASTGKYFIQVATLRDSGQAKTVANSVAQRHGTLLKGRRPTVETGVLGNMGKFYLVRIRAFRTETDAAKLCSKLLASGLDCLVNKS